MSWFWMFLGLAGARQQRGILSAEKYTTPRALYTVSTKGHWSELSRGKAFPGPRK